MPRIVAQFFNVGHGDCTLIEIDRDHLILVDSNCTPGTSTSPALRFLKERHQSGKSVSLDLLCLTHPDQDHYRGMAEVIEFVEQHGTIKQVVRCGIDGKLLEYVRKSVESTSSVPALQTTVRSLSELERLFGKLDKYKKAIDCGPSHVGTIGTAEVVVLGPTIGFRAEYERCAVKRAFRAILRARKGHHARKPRQATANPLSIILWIKMGETSLMLTGDTDARSWMEAIETYEKAPFGKVGPSARATVVKAPHHGAECSLPAVWARVLKSSSSVVISAGKHDSWKHPCEETLDAIRSANQTTQIYCTNVCPMVRDHWKQNLPPQVVTHIETQSVPVEQYHGDIEATFEAGATSWRHMQPPVDCRFHRESVPIVVEGFGAAV